MSSKIDWKVVLSDENLSTLESFVGFISTIPFLGKYGNMILKSIEEIRWWRRVAVEFQVIMDNAGPMKVGPMSTASILTMAELEILRIKIKHKVMDL